MDKDRRGAIKEMFKFKVGDIICQYEKFGYISKIEGRPRRYIHVRWFDEESDIRYSMDYKSHLAFVKVS